MFKTLTKFQKQIIGIVAVLAVTAVLFTVYSLRAPKDDGNDTEESAEPQISFNYGFSEQELEALGGFSGTAEFCFAADKGKADALVAPLMALADDYAAAAEGISVSFGKGDNDMSLTVNGVKTVIDIDAEGMFRFLEDGTPYAFSARSVINTALFGGTLDVAEAEPLSGYDLDGDVINSGGNIELYSLGSSVKDLEYVVLDNEYGETRLIVLDGSVYVNNAEGMTINSTTAMFLLSFARVPVAVGKVQDPTDKAAYGLDSESAVCTLIVADSDENVHTLIIGDVLPDGTGRYMLCDDREHIYMSNAYIEYALQPAESFLSADYGEAFSSSSTVFDAIDDITVDFGDETVVIKQLTDEETAQFTLNYSWKVLAPDRFVDDNIGFALSNYYRISDLFYSSSSSSGEASGGLTSLSSSEIVSAKATDEAIEKYGLDDPYRVFSWVQDGNLRCTVYFGTPDGNGDMYVYGTKETVEKNNDGEYTVKASVTLGIGVVNLNDYPNVAMEPVEYVNDALYAEYASSLSSITFERGDRNDKLTFIKDDNGKIDSIKLNGSKTDRQSALYLYKDILSCSVLGEYDGDVPEPDLTVTLTKDGVDTVITFARVTTVKVFCTVNGKGLYYISYSDFETLIADYESVLAGEIVTG